MKIWIVAGLLAAVLLAGPAAAKHAGAGFTRGVANAALIAKVRATPVKLVDYDQDRCDERTVEQCLKALTGPNARAVAWSAGPCQIVGPGIDRGSDWRAQETVTLAHPRDRHDQPMIEVFFEEPVKGRPGGAYALRGAMRASDGDDMTRLRKDFEANWTSRFPAPDGAIVDCADD